jgi:nuclear transport factor 2 (NTF2) superfamily protein
MAQSCAMEFRPPFPPFDAMTATAKVRAAEDVWNTRDAQ